MKKKQEKLPIIFKLGQSKLQYQIPLIWSINKIKCLLTSDIPALNFDQFQLTIDGQLLRGTYKLKDIIGKNENNFNICLQIIKRKSEIKLKQYYQQSMTKIMTCVSANEKQPILSTQYARYRQMMQTKNNDRQNNNENDLDAINQANQEMNGAEGNGAHPLFRAFRLIGTYLLLVLIYDHGKAYQIFIILAVILCYFGLGWFVKYRQRKIRNQNQRNRQNVNNPIKNQPQVIDQQNKDVQKNKNFGLLVLYFYRITQVLFCFLWTFFPNLTIQMHLQINRQKIDRAKKKINQMLPNSYQEENNQNQLQNR